MYVWDKRNLQMRHTKRLPTVNSAVPSEEGLPSTHQSLGSYPIDQVWWHQPVILALGK